MPRRVALKAEKRIRVAYFSHMYAICNHSLVTNSPAKLPAAELNWLLRSQEEALPSITKWLVPQLNISVFPQRMLFAGFTQRTDISGNIRRFNAAQEEAFGKQVTLHFVESGRGIQLEIEAIISDRSECVALLTAGRCELFHAEQTKSKAFFA